ncbi:MAG: YncE family protein [Clostridium sp.]|uniref:YncE family protein n=1 Tax=Clostridium sp. TaxID=1506 RepID=UPI002FC88DE2
MNSIYVCNAKEDSITKINLDDMSLETLHLRVDGRLMGPSNIDVKGEIGVVANSYNNTISLLNIKDFKEEDCDYIGANPVDVKIYRNYVYALCNELNAIVIYDLDERCTVLKIPSGNSPQNITINEDNEIMLVSNLLDKTISIIDLKENVNVGAIQVSEYPIKVKFSCNRELFYVCESSLDDGEDGYVSIYKVKDYSLIKRVKVGIMPVDIYESKDILYVLNAGDSTVLEMNLEKKLEKKEMYISGMPKSIIKFNENYFISDYFNDKLYILDKSYNKEKIITLGKEPNAMILVTSNHQIIN